MPAIAWNPCPSSRGIDARHHVEHALWGQDLPIQRCTVHKHRNLLAHAPKHMHEQLGEDYRVMIHADTADEVEKQRKSFLRKWRLK